MGLKTSGAMSSALMALLGAGAAAHGDTIYTYTSNLDPFGSQSSQNANPVTFQFSMVGSLAANTNYFACYGESCRSVPTGASYLPFPQVNYSYNGSGVVFPATTGQISGNQIAGAGDPQIWGTYAQYVQYE